MIKRVNSGNISQNESLWLIRQVKINSEYYLGIIDINQHGRLEICSKYPNQALKIIYFNLAIIFVLLGVL